MYRQAQGEGQRRTEGLMTSMPSDVKPFGVGMIGSGPAIQYVIERISLNEELTPAIAFVEGVRPYPLTSRTEVRLADSAAEILRDPQTSVIYFTGSVPAQIVAKAIQAKRHVVLEPSHGLSSAELSDLSKSAESLGVIATVHQPHYWSEDFRWATSIVRSGRIGRLLRLRLSIHDMAIPGDTFSGGLLRELGYHWIDQLLILTSSAPRSTALRRFPRSASDTSDGFLATIDFDDETSAVIEVQTRSLLSFRTGWYLEGTSGAYRSGRAYSIMPDGEIVDEPLPKIDFFDSDFFEVFAAALQSESTPDASFIPRLNHAARVMQLIEQLEQSAR
jgi:predicted dehydrogenase